jgi:DNA ligase-4
MDQWGDRYSEAADPVSLAELMALVRASRGGEQPGGEGPIGGRGEEKKESGEGREERRERSSEARVAEFWRGLDDGAAASLHTRHGMLRGAVVFVPSKCLALRLRLRLFGASTLETPSAEATHAALPSATAAAERRRLRDALTGARVADARPSVRAHLVSERWLEECERLGERAPEEPEGAWFDDGTERASIVVR